MPKGYAKARNMVFPARPLPALEWLHDKYK
jgi:hypothetical protein